MDGTEVAKIVWGLVILAGVVFVCLSAFQKRGSGHYAPGAGAYGAVYDLLNEDKRKAVEIIVEHKAESRDPERATDKNPCE